MEMNNYEVLDVRETKYGMILILKDIEKNVRKRLFVDYKTQRIYFDNQKFIDIPNETKKNLGVIIRGDNILIKIKDRFMVKEDIDCYLDYKKMSIEII